MGLQREHVELKQPVAEHMELHDKGIRLALIPFFGIVIPNLTGVFGSLKPQSSIYWAGYPYFILLSFLVWQGNRFFLLKQREHFDWFNHPVRKIIVLLLVSAFYTAPLAVLMHLGWYSMAGFAGPDWNAIRLSTLTIVICAVFITHIYEMVYLIQLRESDMLYFERLERAKIQAELTALKNQIDPHFMFNSLNALSFLIEHDREKALQFNTALADVYRYILLNKSQELVLLKDEIEFLGHYCALLKLRFSEGIQISLPADEDLLNTYLIPPISLQVLLENAVKHNQFSVEQPLQVRLAIERDTISVCNEVRRRSPSNASSNVGLKNLDERYRLIMQEGIRVDSAGSRFTVTLPLLKAS
jgi:hypothetical protein